MKALVASIALVLLVTLSVLALVSRLTTEAPAEAPPEEALLAAPPAPATNDLHATLPTAPATLASLPEAAPSTSTPTPATLPRVTPTPRPELASVDRLEAWSAPASLPTVAALERAGCDPAYPDERTCIPTGPPFDQGCAITEERLFTVLPPDPQGLDHDGDGIGCEPIRR